MLDPKTFLRVLLKSEGILSPEITVVDGKLRLTAGIHNVELPHDGAKASTEELKRYAHMLVERVKAA